jgi:CubicO group peptidase (beta-lactamase class C family)
MQWIRNAVALASVVTLAGALAAALGAQELAQTPPDARRMYSGEMLPDEAVRAFANSDKMFPVRVVRHGAWVRELPAADVPLRNVRFNVSSGLAPGGAGKTYDLFDYLALNRVVGILVLKNGKVALEDYELGTGPATLWPSFSVAKSASSTLVGAALQDGAIGSLDDRVTKYVPALQGGAYEGVSVRNVLQMASGVRWDETYTDPKSDRRKLLDLQLAPEPKPGFILAYMSALPKAGGPGSIWNYNTGETYVVGAVLEGATHKRLGDYLSEKIWGPWGMESDARWWLETPDGMGLAGGGLSATLRDFGRLGLLVLADGVIDGKRLVPAGWFEEAGSAKSIGGKMVDYGYLWWPVPKGDPVHEGAFEAIGIFGQHMYVNRREKLVVVILSARPKPTGSTVVEDDAFFAAVVQGLK